MRMKPGKKILSPAVWRGNELLRSQFWGMRFPAGKWGKPWEGLSTDLLSNLQNELENGHGAVLIEGIDTSQGSDEDWKEYFLKFCTALGTPVSQSAAGEKIFSVRDAGYGSDDQRTRGPNTRKKLSFHTDRCDVIAFLCLQPAKIGGDNQVVSSLTLYNEMLERRPELVEVLSQPFYYQRHNVDQGNESPFTQQPVFSFFDGLFASNFLRVLIDRAYSSGFVPPMTPIQKEALDTLENLAADPELNLSFRQKRGDILLLNNWVTYHRRTEFEDFSEPEKRRHLLRVWLSMPNSRAVDPMFGGNYGATAAGALRGGMRSVQS